MMTDAIANVTATVILEEPSENGELGNFKLPVLMSAFRGADEDAVISRSHEDNSSAIIAFLHNEAALERRDSLYIVLPITVIYMVIFFTGVIGNISTCVVIARNKSMHTATNYYLFSLAVSDLLLLVSGLPPEMYYIWSHFPYIFGEAFCIVQSFAAETSANATVLTITAFTVER